MTLTQCNTDAVTLTPRWSRSYRRAYDRCRRSFVYDPGLKRQLTTMADYHDFAERSVYLDLVEASPKPSKPPEDRIVCPIGTEQDVEDFAINSRFTPCKYHPDPSKQGAVMRYLQGLSPLPCDERTVDMSRVVKSRQFRKPRGFRLYPVVALAGLELFARLGYRFACCVVRDDLDGERRMLRRIGFREVESGKRWLSWDVPGQAVRVIPMMTSLREDRAMRVAAWDELGSQLSSVPLTLTGIDWYASLAGYQRFSLN